MKYKIKQFMKADVSKFYILGVGIICLLLLGGYFSYAMFTVSKEKNNAISIITGNITYNLTVNGNSVDGGNTFPIAPGETEYTVVLSNTTNRRARFNFYYVGDLPSGVEVGYKTGDGLNIPPGETGINLEAMGTSGSSNTYLIKISNSSFSNAEITFGVSAGLDYNDLSLPSDGHLFEEAKLSGPVADIVLENIGDNGSTNDAGEDTFITVSTIL